VAVSSHRDPQLQTYYLNSQRFFYEDKNNLRNAEMKTVAQCYDHCTNEGSLATGNFENYTTSRQKGCSNYDYQDINVFSAFFMEPLRRQGVFVEIGDDGWGASNTLFFEHCLDRRALRHFTRQLSADAQEPTEREHAQNARYGLCRAGHSLRRQDRCE
jgi:hypothetical protein